MSVVDLVCVAMVLSATSSGVREMVAFTTRGDVKCTLIRYCSYCRPSTMYVIKKIFVRLPEESSYQKLLALHALH